MYLERVIRFIETTPDLTILQIGDFVAKAPSGCLLEKKQKVQISVDPYFQILLYIASEVCSGCPLKGNTCRYGIDP